MSNHEPRLTGAKVCSKCGRELPVISFAVNKTYSDGLQAHCRDCQRSLNIRRSSLKSTLTNIALKQKYEFD